MSPFFSDYGLLTSLPLTKSLAPFLLSYFLFLLIFHSGEEVLGIFVSMAWEFVFVFVLCCFVEMAKRKERNDLATQLSRCDVKV